MKKFILPALGLIALAPTAALAKDEAVKRFEHEGSTYSYTVTKVGDTRVISGFEERTGKPFTLRVGARRVRGTVGSQQVSFALRDVEPLKNEPATLASR
ncbi:hypothetical protein OVY29_11570 [Sphingopyxis sp. SE2]|jgi:hypothetical protein|uniref:hypothetical protein n=1 Tax=unclassified Sphingopyxis TaxID=2614943 RepID=UPI00050FC7F9|nr:MULTISPECIES: hypothetical protein [unclassified Sphingopyxis]KGB56491.1 hypotheticall protein [Sphingopyxis sp. LC363]MDT7529302.1 hypothetical protein [Sphingopyxis sp. SE2]